MSEPTDYEVRRDALFAAASCRQGGPVSEILATANLLSVWLWDGLRTSESSPEEEEEPSATGGVEPDPVDLWSKDKYCVPCGHLKSFHSHGYCFVILGKSTCGCTHVPGWIP